jgi:exodeoxyribonuclease-3
MRITTWNVNGLRAAIRKGFQKHIEDIAPDILLLQEVRSLPDQLPAAFVNPDGWYVYWNAAKKPGYSGTAIWSRYPLEHISTGLDGDDSDEEGRLLVAVANGVSVASVYLPSGSSGEARQQVKDRWLDAFAIWAESRRTAGPVFLGGDLNIAHTEQDIFYARANEKTSGFLPHERAWFGKLLRSGWHDLVREHHGDVQGPYSWWSNRGKARELDRGWRIDYMLCNSAAHPAFCSATVHRQGGLEVSDHAPVSIDILD